MLLRQKLPQLQSKRQANSKFNFPNDELLLSHHGAESPESKDENEMIDLIEDPILANEESTEYVTVILANEESTESDDENIELVEESSEMLRDEEYIVTEESLDEIPKMTLKKHRSRRRGTKDAQSLTCDECGKTLSNFSSYKYHMQLHSEDTPFLCR